MSSQSLIPSDVGRQLSDRAKLFVMEQVDQMNVVSFTDVKVTADTVKKMRDPIQTPCVRRAALNAFWKNVFGWGHGSPNVRLVACQRVMRWSWLTFACTSATFHIGFWLLPFKTGPMEGGKR